MCGIAGMVDWSGRGVDPRIVATMTRLLAHRGPDDEGFAFFDVGGRYMEGVRRAGGAARNMGETPMPQNTGKMPVPRCGLGHRRLSILDLCETGHQPMSTPDGRYWITYNGEIYNYLELRGELEGVGHSFRGTGDTEVLLHSYRQWGRDCVTHFNGMWAFAIWDCIEQTLFCSRDRFGIKPFYYHHGRETFAFASEIKSVLAGLPPEKRKVNEPYLGRFILQGRMNDGEQTCFEHVEQLRPAHCLLIKDEQVRRWRYWDVPGEAAAERDFDKSVERFHELLADAIRLRFRADVPVGVCLSGGLDSSSVTALAAKQFDVPLRTFTVAYDEPGLAEGHYARRVARQFGTEAHFRTPGSADYLDFIEPFTWHHDEPCVGAGMFSQWQVMRLAAESVKVVLEGQGADELLGGYRYYGQYYLLARLRDLLGPSSQDYTFASWRRDLRAIADQNGASSVHYLLNTLKHLLYEPLPAEWKRGYRSLKTSVWGQLVEPEWRRVYREGSVAEKKFGDPLNAILHDDLTRDNLPMLLQNGDRISMAFSVESRLPFLDYRLVEFAAGLPYWFKVQGDQTKRLLRAAMKGILPEEIVGRRDKLGFPTPFGHWLRGPLKDYARDMLGGTSFRGRGIIRPEKALGVLQDHIDGRADRGWLIWRMLNLETWLLMFHDDFKGTCEQRANTVNK